MLRRHVRVTTPPAAEPVTLDEAKNWARIDATDEDAYLAPLLTAAIQSAEQYLRRALINQTLLLSVDLDRCGLNDLLGDGVYDLPVTALYGGLPSVIELPLQPVSSITSVTTYDLTNTSSTFSSASYTLNNGRLVLSYGASWPSNLRPLGAAEIAYVAGYGATGSSVPAPIKQAIQIQFAHLYESRGLCDDPSGVCPAAQTLLRQYRVMDHRG